MPISLVKVSLILLPVVHGLISKMVVSKNLEGMLIIFQSAFSDMDSYSVKTVQKANFDPTVDSKLPLTTVEHMSIISPVPPDCNISRPRRLTMLTRRPAIFIIEPGQFEDAVQAISKTLTLCQDEVDGGLLKGSNVFIFMTNDNLTAADIFEKDILKMHRYVATASSVDNCILFKVFNIYTGEVMPVRILCETGGLGQAKIKVMGLFPNFDMQGYKFIVGNLPFAYFTYADYNPAASDPRKSLINRGGMEIDMLNAICQKLDCKYEFFNPPDLSWGTTVAGKPATGLYGELVNNDIDFFTSNTIDYYYNHVVQPGTVRVDTSKFCAISSRKSPKRSAKDMLKPLGPWVWILTSLFLLAMPLTFYAFQMALKHYCDEKNTLHDFAGSLWFVFSTFLGENSWKDRYVLNFYWTIRILAGTWLLFAFITTTSYAGNLKATRLNPAAEHPINNVHDIVHSGLQWHMFNYGDFLDYHISQQEGDDYKIFLRDRKEIVAWLDVPYQEVLDAYQKKSIYVDYEDQIDLGVRAVFPNTHGASLVHLSDHLFAFVKQHYLLGYAFHPLNPWSERFNPYLGLVLDHGLDLHWIEKGRHDFVAKTKSNTDIPTLKIDGDNNLHATTYAEISAFVYLFLIMLLISIVLFSIEVGFYKTLLKVILKYWPHEKKETTSTSMVKVTVTIERI